MTKPFNRMFDLVALLAHGSPHEFRREQTHSQSPIDASGGIDDDFNAINCVRFRTLNLFQRARATREGFLSGKNYTSLMRWFRSPLSPPEVSDFIGSGTICSRT